MGFSYGNPVIQSFLYFRLGQGLNDFTANDFTAHFRVEAVKLRQGVHQFLALIG
jgi:hypothetical protein